MASGVQRACLEHLGHGAPRARPRRAPAERAATPDPELATHPNLTLRTP